MVLAGVAGIKKKAVRTLADNLVAFPGITYPRAVTYEEHCGLWLQIERARIQQAAPLALAIHAALSHDPLGREWADALAKTEAEVSTREATTMASIARLRNATGAQWDAARTQVEDAQAALDSSITAFETSLL